MYNLTDSQKKFVKWLVQNVREKKLDEEFHIQWSFTPFDELIPICLSNYRGTDQELQNIDISKGCINALAMHKLLLYQVLQSDQDGSYINGEIKLPRPEIWNCTLTSDIYKAVDNDFENPELPKSPRHKQNPWTSGSFYLFALVVVSASFAVISAYIPWYIIPILLIAAIIALGVIGAFQLRMDGELNESNFLTLMIETYKRLPLLVQYKTKPPIEK
ncbi:hypothetical protein [Pseudanabaena sp. Chao 1811]|uniref:hypothetical protein n=1 Tax=Pseudanabaena sp. Chao 1811 TaxID=2963092 RepID=UPI0022F3CC1A|nr:hypothetical protein [Pseudanabaena sp. Chao 1811]